MDNSLFGVQRIKLGSGQKLTIDGDTGIVIPVGGVANRPPLQDAIIRYNTDHATFELYADGEIIELGKLSNTFNTFIGKHGGTISGDLNIADGGRIVLQGTATIDGMNPALIQQAFTGLANGDGFIVRDQATDTYVHRQIVGGNGIILTNGDGINDNPSISIAPSTITIGGNITDVYGGEPTLRLDGMDHRVDLYARVAPEDIPNLNKATIDTVASAFNAGTVLGVSISANTSTTPILNLIPNQYDISLTGAISGLATVVSARNNVAISTQFSDSSKELVLRGGSDGVDIVSNGVRLRYEKPTRNAYLELLTDDPTSGLYFITGASNSAKIAAYVQDGKLYATTAEIDDISGNALHFYSGDITNVTSDSIITNTANITTLDMSAPDAVANINSINSSSISTETLTVSSTTSFNGTTTVDGPIVLNDNVLITGRLIVTGDASEVSSSNTAIGDNIISLNVGETGAGVSLGYSGFEIDRGSLPTAQFVWDEINDMFIPKLENGNKVAFGGVATPVLDSQVGDRLYNDNRYLRDTNAGLNGFVVRSPKSINPSSTVTQARSILGGSGVNVTNGDGQNGNPVISLANQTVTLQGAISGSATSVNRDALVINTYLNSSDATLVETVGDIVGGMVTGTTNNGIAVNYNDTTGKLAFDVNDFSITLTGDVTGTATVTNLANTSITCTVVDGSHNHDTQYYSKTAADGAFVNIAGDTMTGDLTTRNMTPFANNTYSVGTSAKKYLAMYATTFYGVAIQAKYADLAERYHADNVYTPGTVLVFGGDNEVTISTTMNDHRVAGIVSTSPALLMNSEAGNDDTHPLLALKGRVPCLVTGEVNKGDLLVTSDIPGVAMATRNPAYGAIIGKAIGAWDGYYGAIGVIEVAV